MRKLCLRLKKKWLIVDICQNLKKDIFPQRIKRLIQTVYVSKVLPKIPKKTKHQLQKVLDPFIFPFSFQQQLTIQSSLKKKRISHKKKK